jgi:cytochrome b
MQHTESVEVWDVFVRIFHWSLVATFVLAYVTEEDALSIHTLAGYAVIGLLVLRIAWGFIGTPFARFADFAYPPAQIRQFLADTLQLSAPRYLGHNPAGGAMIFLMIASLVLTTMSGVVVLGANEHAGPLAGLFAAAGEPMGEIYEEIHEFFANFSVLLIAIHVGGVLLESLIHRENLVLSMVTGRKRSPHTAEGE